MHDCAGLHVSTMRQSARHVGQCSPNPPNFAGQLTGVNNSTSKAESVSPRPHPAGRPQAAPACPSRAATLALRASGRASRARRGCRRLSPPPSGPAAWRSACARCRSWPTRRTAPAEGLWQQVGVNAGLGATDAIGRQARDSPPISAPSNLNTGSLAGPSKARPRLVVVNLCIQLRLEGPHLAELSGHGRRRRLLAHLHQGAARDWPMQRQEGSRHRVPARLFWDHAGQRLPAGAEMVGAHA